jgi:hypothetical protein
MATYKYVATTSGSPVLIYPHVAWTWRCNSYIMWHRRPNAYNDFLCHAVVNAYKKA